MTDDINVAWLYERWEHGGFERVATLGHPETLELEDWRSPHDVCQEAMPLIQRWDVKRIVEDRDPEQELPEDVDKEVRDAFIAGIESERSRILQKLDQVLDSTQNSGEE